MHLLQLPPETLAQIMTLVGASHFREDLSRLAISKEWYRYAIPVWLEDLVLCESCLRGLMSSSYAVKNSLYLKDSVRALDLQLRSRDSESALHCKLFRQRVMTSRYLWPLGMHKAENFLCWIQTLSGATSHLATILKNSQRPRALRIRAGARHVPDDLANYDFVQASTLQTFLSIKNLTFLELELCSYHPINFQSQFGWPHICPDIAGLLGTLKELRLRMQCICPEALRLPTPKSRIKLNTVLVNLNLNDRDLPVESMDLAWRCGATDEQAFASLKADMKAQAEVLATHMESPKIFRLLTKKRSCRMLSLDILTGKTMRLDKNATWDDDGEVLDNKAWENEAWDDYSDIMEDEEWDYDSETSENEVWQNNSEIIHEDPDSEPESEISSIPDIFPSS